MNMVPYIMTLHPGNNPAKAAARAAQYIINRWMPNNAGGIHLMVTPRLATALLTIYREMKKETQIRVTIQGNIPNLEVL